MFTGIVEELGTVRSAERRGVVVRLAFDAPGVVNGARIGDSIAVDGVCLTVVDLGPGWWAADTVEETLRRTTLGRLRPGDRVNFERPVRAGDRLGGHVVLGHVDGVGEILEPAPALCVRVPVGLAHYIAPKGSVSVDGCSLTVVDVEDDRFSVAVIPHTAAATTLGRKSIGDFVNVEVDVIARYVERLLGAGATVPGGPG